MPTSVTGTPFGTYSTQVSGSECCAARLPPVSQFGEADKPHDIGSARRLGNEICMTSWVDKVPPLADESNAPEPLTKHIRHKPTLLVESPEEEDMNGALAYDNSGFRLTFDGSMTIAFSDELEDKIFAAVRQNKRLDVDLSRVSEIDLCGVHLIRLMQTVGGKGVAFVATSPVVDFAVQGVRTAHGA